MLTLFKITTILVEVFYFFTYDENKTVFCRERGNDDVDVWRKSSRLGNVLS
ncbi:MAG: hypothetical protein J6L64_05105 [Opitutales bacterium]|nr:hypothetical protein [Opitutales bacterium]